VWPWLLGQYFDAYFRLKGWNEQTVEWARQFLQPLREHLTRAGLGTVSEIFEGDPPHAPRGCIAQAWSVAELLRLQVELLK
jgi:glycogen debranching enzyme